MEEEKKGSEKEVWKTYIEHKTISPFWGWVLLLALSAALIAFGMIAHFIVPDVPREWSYGSYPQTPAESAYSTNEPEKGVIPPERVIPMLPEAKPVEEGRQSGLENPVGQGKK